MTNNKAALKVADHVIELIKRRYDLRQTDGGWENTAASKKKLGVVLWIRPNDNGTVYFHIKPRLKSGRFSRGYGHSLSENHIPQAIAQPTPQNKCYWSYYKLVLDDLLSAEGAPLTTKKTELPPPNHFCNSEDYNELDGELHKMFYRTCKVEKCVALSGLKIKPDIISPDQDCWFLVSGRCANRGSDALPQMIVRQDADGKLIFYPVMMNTVQHNLQREGTYVDYTHASDLDEKLIRKAIARFLEKV